MRAESRHRNLTYVMKPATWRTDAQGHKNGTVEGMRIVFGGLRSGFFDSESITDAKKRKAVEQFLRNHPDNGVYYHIVDEPTVTQDSSVVEGRISTATAEAPPAVCVATITEPGKESRLCGKPVASGDDLCADCKAKAEAA